MHSVLNDVNRSRFYTDIAELSLALRNILVNFATVFQPFLTFWGHLLQILRLNVIVWCFEFYTGQKVIFDYVNPLNFFLDSWPWKGWEHLELDSVCSNLYKMSIMDIVTTQAMIGTIIATFWTEPLFGC